MIKLITGRNVPEAYNEALWAMQVCGVGEQSRNGDVIAIPYPVMLEIQRPWERVLFSPIRDANPFFHVMEFVWMMAGSNDAEWLAQFNKQILEYANEHKVLRGAYGWRWVNPSPQITDVIELLRETQDTRQAVLSMWDPVYDGPRADTLDRPCNTHIYFRRVNGKLDMTVCNRSNDLIWGMMGANAVHMTMLHEFISLATGIEQGVYRVFTNNLHVYCGMPRHIEIMGNRVKEYDYYAYDGLTTQPLLEPGEKWQDFLADAYQMVDSGLDFEYKTEWFNWVASPMHDAYLDKQLRAEFIENITAPDWKIACREWHRRRIN